MTEWEVCNDPAEESLPRRVSYYPELHSLAGGTLLGCHGDRVPGPDPKICAGISAFCVPALRGHVRRGVRVVVLIAGRLREPGRQAARHGAIAVDAAGNPDSQRPRVSRILSAAKTNHGRMPQVRRDCGAWFSVLRKVRLRSDPFVQPLRPRGAARLCLLSVLREAAGSGCSGVNLN